MTKPTIFISHINEEKDIAKSLKEFLEYKFLQTVNVFASTHDDSISLGDEWLTNIKSSLNDAQIIIVLCSPISVVRPWINFEAGAGWIKGIPVIPLCHSGLTPGNLPVPLNTFQGGIISQENDIKRVFTTIAKKLNMSAPDITGTDFFDAVNKFEIVIQNSILLKDTLFVYRLLSKSISLLKHSIYASTLSYNNLRARDLKDFNSYSFVFKDIANLFNVSMLMTNVGQRVFQVYRDTVIKLIENIKFILSYNHIQIAPVLRELLNDLLYNSDNIEGWNNEFLMMINPNNKAAYDLTITMINEAGDLPPTDTNGNMILYSALYYNSLRYYQQWVIKLELVINSIIQ